MSATLTLDPLGDNMEVVVAALPTQQGRDELTLFIEEHLKRGTDAGILRGMFLLLKANRCYLEKLPGQFNFQLIEPMRDLFLRLEKSLNAQIETQKQIAFQYQRSNERSIEVMDQVDAIVPKIENVVQRSVDKVDTKALTRQITATLLESTVEPVRMTHLELVKLVVRLNELIGKAKDVLETLLKIGWRSMLFGSLSVSFLLSAVIFYFAYHGMQQSFDSSLESIRAEHNQKLLALQTAVGDALGTAANNDYIGKRLSRLQVTTDVQPLADGIDHYAFSISKAYNAKVLPDGTGVIYFRGQI